MADALHMNWAYGVEFLEIDSKQLGTDTFEDKEDPQARQQLIEQFRVDKDRVRALHGNAVLSRYPIRDARLVPFKVGYDWFKNENFTLEKTNARPQFSLVKTFSRRCAAAAEQPCLWTSTFRRSRANVSPSPPRIWKTVPSQRFVVSKWKSC